MGKLLHFPDPVEFGQCPRCGGFDGYYCVGKERWGTCHKHMLKWLIRDEYEDSEEQLPKRVQALI